MIQMIRVLLLNPPTRHGQRVIRDNLFGCFTKSKAEYLWPQINLALIGAVLKETGVKPEIIDAVAVRYSLAEISRKLKEFRPDFVLITTASPSFDSDCWYVSKLKKILPDLKSIMIGNYVTLFPKESFKNKMVDYIIRGEPEFTLKEMFIRLRKKGSLDDVKGLAWRKGGLIVDNGISPTIENLDSLPFADRDLIPEADYFNPLIKKTPYTTMNTSRGCPFPCIYCSCGQTYGKRFRARSAKNVVDEIELCVRRYGIKEVFFRDEEFTLDKKRVQDICRQIIDRDLKVGWICNSRIDTLDDKTLNLMRRSGCHMIKLGIESGSDKMLKSMKKCITVETIKRNFALIKKNKIEALAHFIIGLPGETKKTLEETRNLVFELEPDYVSFNIAVPFPGTELFETYKDKLKGKKMSDYDLEKSVVKANFTEIFCALPKEYLEEYYNRIHKDFYFRPKYILKRLFSVSSPSELWRYFVAGLSLLSFTRKNQ